jgi:methionyl aminopeptidase
VRDAPGAGLIAIWLKSPDEIDRLHRAGAVLSDILRDAADEVRPGRTTAQVELFIREAIEKVGAEPVMLGYRGTKGDAPPFPSAAAVCINEEVVHAVPGPRLFRTGDIATVDCALRYGGWCADAAISMVVGQEARGAGEAGSPGAESGHDRLAAAVRRVVIVAIEACGPGVPWSEVVRAAVRAAETEGYWLLPDFAGHGIGRNLHETPGAGFEIELRGSSDAPKSGGAAGLDFVLRPGMTFTIEPVLVSEPTRVLGLDDGWTTVTADRSAAAHEEHTVAITRAGVRVLTA